jgi:hypothetical protein
MGAADAQCVASGPPGDGRQLWGGAVHPKNAGLAAAVAGSSVQVRGQGRGAVARLQLWV